MVFRFENQVQVFKFRYLHQKDIQKPQNEFSA